MTDIVVTGNGTTVVVDTTTTHTIVTGIMGPAGADSLAQLTDIDKTGLVDGATLIYNASTSQWKTTKLLDNQILEAGQF